MIVLNWNVICLFLISIFVFHQSSFVLSNLECFLKTVLLFKSKFFIQWFSFIKPMPHISTYQKPSSYLQSCTKLIGTHALLIIITFIIKMYVYKMTCMIQYPCSKHASSPSLPHQAMLVYTCLLFIPSALSLTTLDRFSKNRGEEEEEENEQH